MSHLFTIKNEKTHVSSNPDGSLALQQGGFWDVDQAVHSGKSFLQSKLDTLKLWKARVDARRELAYQNDRILADIGLTRFEVEQEANKWFWQN